MNNDAQLTEDERAFLKQSILVGRIFNPAGIRQWYGCGSDKANALWREFRLRPASTRNPPRLPPREE